MFYYMILLYFFKKHPTYLETVIMDYNIKLSALW